MNADNIQRFNRTALSRRDFHEAAEFLQALATETNRTNRYALLTAAIIAYARPFSRNELNSYSEAASAIHIDPSSILTPEQISLHTEIIRLRRKLVAHAEFAQSPVHLLDSSPDGMVLHGPYIEADGRHYDLRDYLFNIDVTMFSRIAELYAVYCLNEMHTLKN